MSRVHIKSGHRSNFRQNVDNLFQLGENIVGLSSRQGKVLVCKSLDLLEAAMASSQERLFRKPCNIPETECPPRCVCELSWHACPGEKIHCTVRVTNTGSATRDFKFTPSPFLGPGNPGSVISVAPDAAILAPDQSVVLNISFGVSNEFIPNQRYEAEVTIVGAYEQCVRIELMVEGEEKHCHCEVEQGDKPIRIRAHRWYDHFQCEEPCERHRSDSHQHQEG